MGRHLSQKKADHVLRLLGQGLGVTAIVRATGVSYTTIERYMELGDAARDPDTVFSPQPDPEQSPLKKALGPYRCSMTRARETMGTPCLPVRQWETVQERTTKEKP